MNVPISVRVDRSLGPVEAHRGAGRPQPDPQGAGYFPLAGAAGWRFRFKLEQASPVRALAQTRDGVWHAGGTWVDSAGGGCTVSGATRKDGSWSQTLGEVSGRMFRPGRTPGGDGGGAAAPAVMHPMDTGLVGGIPAFYVNKLSVRDAADRELARCRPSSR
jgi:sulfur-oxidizing protein SoxY